MEIIIGIIITVYLILFHRHDIRVELDKVAKFLAFMAIVTAFRLALGSYFQTPPLSDSFPIQFWQFALVFWEDAYFVAPLYFTYKMRDHKYFKYVWYALAIYLSVDFGLGHAYQGLKGVIITSIYPVFISLRYSRKVGIGTVMVCHILYDMITYTTAKYGFLLH
jgi:hypothetical protein